MACGLSGFSMFAAIAKPYILAACIRNAVSGKNLRRFVYFAFATERGSQRRELIAFNAKTRMFAFRSRQS